MMLKDMDELRDIAGNCADRDGAWDYDGEPALRKWVEAKIAEAQAAERERCARIAEDVAEGHHMPIIREAAYAIRRSSPDPEFLAREHLDAWLTEHKTCCRQCVDAEERGVKSECVRRIDLEALIQYLKEKLKALEGEKRG